MSNASELMRNAAVLDAEAMQAIYDIIKAAAVARYVLKGSAPGDVSVDLDRVRAEMPTAFEAILAVYAARLALLSTKG
jgi:hypothetical protein